MFPRLSIGYWNPDNLVPLDFSRVQGHTMTTVKIFMIDLNVKNILFLYTKKC